MKDSIMIITFLLLAIFVIDIASSGGFSNSIILNAIKNMTKSFQDILFSIRYTA